MESLPSALLLLAEGPAIYNCSSQRNIRSALDLVECLADGDTTTAHILRSLVSTERTSTAQSLKLYLMVALLRARRSSREAVAEALVECAIENLGAPGAGVTEPCHTTLTLSPDDFHLFTPAQLAAIFAALSDRPPSKISFIERLANSDDCDVSARAQHIRVTLPATLIASVHLNRIGCQKRRSVTVAVFASLAASDEWQDFVAAVLTAKVALLFVQQQLCDEARERLYDAGVISFDRLGLARVQQLVKDLRTVMFDTPTEFIFGVKSSTIHLPCAKISVARENDYPVLELDIAQPKHILCVATEDISLIGSDISLHRRWLTLASAPHAVTAPSHAFPATRVREDFTVHLLLFLSSCLKSVLNSSVSDDDLTGIVEGVVGGAIGAEFFQEFSYLLRAAC